MPAPENPTRRWWLLADAALAAVLLALGMAEVWAALPSRQGAGSPGWSSVAVALCALALVARRVRPVAVVAVIGAGMFLLYLLVPVYVLFYGTFVPVAVAAYSVARHARGRGVWVGAGWVAVGIVGVTTLVPGQRTPGDVLFNVGGLALAWLAGFTLAALEHRAAAAQRRAVQSEVDAATLAMSAVLDERTRIARELHDIVAHAISLIVVQAGAAEPAVDDDPAFARAALGSIRTTGVGALADMRRMVTMLRDEDPAQLAPQPGTDGVPELVAHARDSGLAVELDVEGVPEGLPAGLDLAVYRIVQEALSNVRRHAAASRAWVCLRYAPEEVVVEVRDDGVGTQVPARTAGHGLVGMRERAALYGGAVDAVGQPGRGFTVRAVLPVVRS